MEGADTSKLARRTWYAIGVTADLSKICVQDQSLQPITKELKETEDALRDMANTPANTIEQLRTQIREMDEYLAA